MKPKLLKIFFCLLLFCIKTSAQNPSKPNIIFILADDIGFTIPTVNGGSTFSTPNIDSMARHGISFTHCEATPDCAPSRMMLLTGKHNFRNYSNWGYMGFNDKTFGNLMRNAGYATGFFGKLQLQIFDSTMYNWGFDRYTVFELTQDTVANQRYKNPVLLDNGYRIPDSLVANKYGDDILTQKLFDFIDSNKQHPFFAYYPMLLVHGPYSPTPDDSAFATWDPNNSRDTTFYPSMIKYMDKKIGEIQARLKSEGLDKNTIVIFSSDNGTSPRISFDIGDITMQGERGYSTEGGTHVPLIAYWPKHVKPGSVNDDLIDFSDFFKTFAEAAGVKNLNQYEPLDGVSFYKRMLGKEDASKHELFLHYNPNPGSRETDTLERWVRDKTYKLYDITPSLKSGNFYNIQIDSTETTPLNDSFLTRKEIKLKQSFRHILDTVGTWRAGPVLKHLTITSIKNHSVIAGATIVSPGATALIERGSTFDEKHFPFLNHDRMPDSVVSLGSFYHQYTDLKPQKQYLYSLYAMNKNVSNSTGYAMGKFYTASNPPTHQAISFTLVANTDQVKLNWKGVTFPTADANKGGYLILISTGTPSLSAEANGHAPGKAILNGNIAALNRSRLPKLPADSAIIYGLSQDSVYNFLLIPFTCNGLSDSTYNYLIKDALTTTRQIQTVKFKLSSSVKQPLCFGDSNGIIIAVASKGSQPYLYKLNENNYDTLSIFNNLSAGNY